MNKIVIFHCVVLISFLMSCDSTKLTKTPIDNFIGVWELKGRSMLDGIEIEITKTSDGNYVGEVVKINDNKYIKFFVEMSETWITDITRVSNFEFILTEKRIGSNLFSIYGLSTTENYYVQFIDDNSFSLGDKGMDPYKSQLRYIRVAN